MPKPPSPGTVDDARPAARRRPTNENWREVMALKFLQISPTYAWVSQLPRVELERFHRGSTAQANVAETYRALGNVVGIELDDWMRRLERANGYFKGQGAPRLFGTFEIGHQVSSRARRQISEAVDAEVDRLAKDGISGAVSFFSVPLRGVKADVLAAISSLLAQMEFEDVQGPSLRAFNIVKDKTREHTVRIAFETVRIRALYPDKPLFFVGNLAGVSPDHVTDPDAKRSEVNGEARRVMEILTSRYMQRAFLFAENAALGVFPSLAPLPQELKVSDFNLEYLRKMFASGEVSNWSSED